MAPQNPQNPGLFSQNQISQGQQTLGKIGGFLKGFLSPPSGTNPTTPPPTAKPTGYDFSNYNPLKSIQNMMAPGALGTRASSPADNLAPAENAIDKKNVPPPSASQPSNKNTYNGIDYNANPLYLRPGESQDQYLARTQGQGSSGVSGSSGASGFAGSSGTANPPAGSTGSSQGGATGGAQIYSPNAGLYGQLVTGLANTPATNQDVGQARQNLLNLQNQYAQMTGNIESRPQGLSEQQGQQGILNRLFASQLSAAQTNLQNALQSQGLQQQALNQAAGLAAPQQYGITGVPFSPVGGNFGDIAGAGSQGGIAGASDVLGRLSMGQQIPQLNSAYQQATGIKTSFENWLKNNKSVLPSDVNLINELKGWVQGQQFSDPRYPELNQFLNEYLNTITPLIGAAGNVTDFKQSIVQNMINPTSQADSVIQQIDNLHGIAGQKLLDMYNSLSNPFNPSDIQGSSQGGTAFGSFFSKNK